MNPNARSKLDEFGCKNFDEYYRTPLWLNFRAKLIEEVYKPEGRWKCEACKCDGDQFDLHHIDYKHFGHFNSLEIRDIHVLCKPCHRALHKDIWKNPNLGSMTLWEATKYVLAGKHLIKEQPKCIIRRL